MECDLPSLLVKKVIVLQTPRINIPDGRGKRNNRIRVAQGK